MTMRPNRHRIVLLGTAILACLASWVASPLGSTVVPIGGFPDDRDVSVAFGSARTDSGETGVDLSPTGPSFWTYDDAGSSFQFACMAGRTPRPLLSPYTGGLEFIVLDFDDRVRIVWSDCWLCWATLELYPTPRLRHDNCGHLMPVAELRWDEEGVEEHFARVDALRLW